MLTSRTSWQSKRPEGDRVASNRVAVSRIYSRSDSIQQALFPRLVNKRFGIKEESKGVKSCVRRDMAIAIAVFLCYTGGRRFHLPDSVLECVDKICLLQWTLGISAVTVVLNGEFSHDGHMGRPCGHWQWMHVRKHKPHSLLSPLFYSLFLFLHIYYSYPGAETREHGFNGPG